MNKTYHLTAKIYIMYSITTMFTISFMVLFILLAVPGSLSIWWNILIFTASLTFSVFWFWRYRITIEGNTITFPQKYRWKRVTVTPEEITKIMFRYFYPTKHTTNRGIRGYKLNLNNNPKTYIKVIEHEFSFQSRYEIFSFLLEHHPDIEQNTRFQQEMLFLAHKVEGTKSE